MGWFRISLGHFNTVSVPDPYYLIGGHWIGISENSNSFCRLLQPRLNQFHKPKNEKSCKVSFIDIHQPTTYTENLDLRQRKDRNLEAITFCQFQFTTRQRWIGNKLTVVMLPCYITSWRQLHHVSAQQTILSMKNSTAFAAKKKTQCLISCHLLCFTAGTGFFPVTGKWICQVLQFSHAEVNWV